MLICKIGNTHVFYTETVLAAKEFLDAELAKCNSIEDLPSQLINLCDGSRTEDFSRFKNKSVGERVLLKFLGQNWKRWIIQDALNTCREAEKEANWVHDVCLKYKKAEKLQIPTQACGVVSCRR